MRGCAGWFAVVFWSCASCCCLRVPTCGTWPEVDEAEIAAKVRESPLVVDHVCRIGEDCVAVEGAEVEVFPVAWGPLFDDATVLVEVEATCRPSTDPAERIEPIVCAGVLLAVYDTTGEKPSLLYVTEDTVIGDEPSGLTYEQWSATTGDGGDWD